MNTKAIVHILHMCKWVKMYNMLFYIMHETYFRIVIAAGYIKFKKTVGTAYDDKSILTLQIFLNNFNKFTHDWVYLIPGWFHISKQVDVTNLLMKLFRWHAVMCLASEPQAMLYIGNPI